MNLYRKITEDTFWPATICEIMSAQPTCNSCQHIDVDMILAGGGQMYQCANETSPCYERSVFPDNDYCAHWSKNNP